MLLDFDPYKAVEAMRDTDPERAAIMEYDGGLSRADAEAAAARLKNAYSGKCGNVIPLFDAEMMGREEKGKAA